MNVQFLEPAQAEFTEAVDYYNAQSEGLGLEFSNEVKAAILRIIEHPEAWFPISKRTRRPIIAQRINFEVWKRCPVMRRYDSWHHLSQGVRRPMQRCTRLAQRHERWTPRPPCPRCGSTRTQRLSEFGSTACKALYRCTACAEPFDYFKPL